jgi:DNA-binding transcriptional MerR regulator
MGEERKETYTISDLASEFDVTARTIRYYEERGLLNPARDNSLQRIYSRRDRLLGKRVFTDACLRKQKGNVKKVPDCFEDRNACS